MEGPGSLVLHQRLEPDEREEHFPTLARDDGVHPTRPGLVEAHAIDVVHQVDAVRGLPELDDQALRCEIGRRFDARNVTRPELF